MKTIELHRSRNFYGSNSWSRWCQCDDACKSTHLVYEHTTATLPEEKREHCVWLMDDGFEAGRHSGSIKCFNPGGVMTESSARSLASKLNAVVEEFKS